MPLVLDVCGTLLDNTHRLHLCPKRKEDGSWPTEDEWARFMAPELVALDGPVAPVWRAVRGLAYEAAHLGKPLLILTGRPEYLRDITKASLRRHAADFGMSARFESALLLMRAPGDRRPSHEVKREHLAWLRSEGHAPSIAFEDRAADARMYREEGLFVFHVAEGEF